MNMFPYSNTMQTVPAYNHAGFPHNALGMVPMPPSSMMTTGFPFPYGSGMPMMAPTKKESKKSKKESKKSKDESEEEDATPYEMQMVVSGIYSMYEHGDFKASDGFAVQTLKTQIKKLAHYSESDKNFDLSDTLFVIDELIEKHVLGKMNKEDGKAQRYKLKGSITQLHTSMKMLEAQCKTQIKAKQVCVMTPSGMKCHKTPGPFAAQPTFAQVAQKTKPKAAAPFSFAMQWPFPASTMAPAMATPMVPGFAKIK